MNAGPDPSRSRLSDLRDRTRSGQLDGLASPSFLAALPVVRHRERIPPAVLAAMAPAWERVWFPPRPVRISTFENVFVAQEGLVLFPNGRVVEQTIEQHSAAAVLTASLAVRGSGPSGFARHLGNVVLCKKPGAAVYGHWLVELLPKAWLASQMPQTNRYMIPAVGGRMSAVMHGSLSLLGIPAGAIIEAGQAPVWVERLIYVHGLASHGDYMSPLTVECLRTIAERVPPSPIRSIFVQRPKGTSRGIVDYERRIRLAEQNGYHAVDPGTLSFVEQISLFKGARRIVGVMGSALANLCFVRPATEVYVLSPATMPDTFFWFLCHHTGAGMIDIRCRVVNAEGMIPYDGQVVLDAGDEDVFGLPGLARPDAGAALFDPVYYASLNDDAANAGIDLLEHYMTRGWAEGRSPSAAFDGEAYRSAYADVRDSGLNPLFHYLRYGRAEGRAVFPVPDRPGAPPAG